MRLNQDFDFVLYARFHRLGRFVLRHECSLLVRDESGVSGDDDPFIFVLFDMATETVINNVDQQDRITVVAADGTFTLKLNREDNVIVDIAKVGSGQVEKHILALYWIRNDGKLDRWGARCFGSGFSGMACRYSRRCRRILRGIGNFGIMAIVRKRLY